ncbi:MAG TPA: uroporphyrinogen decarboxylase family protein, partial [Anaerolineae bacterium]
MNTRERFQASMRFEPVDRPLFWEFGYWTPTLRRWYREGLSCHAGIDDGLGDDSTVSAECLGVDWRNPNLDHDVNRALGFDEPLYRIPANNLFFPPFEPTILAESEESLTMVNTEGETVRVSKANGSRHFLDSPVKTRQDYYRLREERLVASDPKRLPADWAALRVTLRERTYPLEYGGNQGFFNSLRRLVGFQRLMTLFFDDPGFVREMIADVADFLIALYDPLLSEVGGDCAMISEDMCYKSGCFISPAMFREFLLPAYRKLTGFYRDHGIRIILVDSDGDVSGLIPLLIEGGVTGLHPFEVTGKCDVVDVRKAFPSFQILGGIDKKALAQGRDAIERELARKVPFLRQGSGYIPFVDHTV